MNRDPLPSVSTNLLLAVQNMESDAWRRLVEVFSPVVMHWCLQSGVDKHSALDIVQEIFVAVARNISSFRRREAAGSFRNWLATICRNKIRDHFRDQAKHPNGRGGTEALNWIQQQQNDADVSDPDDSINEQWLGKMIPFRVVELVRSECQAVTWQAFWMSTIDNVSPAAVAEKLEISLATVYQAKSRVLRRIRQRLQELP